MAFVVIHKAGTAAPYTPLTADMVKRLLANPQAMQQIPALAALQGTQQATQKPGGCGGCARRAAEANLLAEASRALAALPEAQRAPLKAFLGVTGALRVWSRVNGVATPTTL